MQNPVLFFKKITIFVLMILSTGSFCVNSVFASMQDKLSVADNYIQSQKHIRHQENGGRYFTYEQMQFQYGINREPRANALLTNIIKRLSTIIAKYDFSVTSKPYRFFVNNKNDINASCGLGHNITVNIGLFKAFNYNEDEIAFIIGHELAHGTNNDVATKIMKNIYLNSAVDKIYSNNDKFSKSKFANKVGTAKGITLPMEIAADQAAFVYCSEAGYNVGAGAAAWQKLIDISSIPESSPIYEILSPSDHPNFLSRRKMYREALQIYSNKKIMVEENTNNIYLNNILLGNTKSSDKLSQGERTFFVAGNLAKALHDDKNSRAYVHNNIVYINNIPIITGIYGDNAYLWAKRINTALKK